MYFFAQGSNVTETMKFLAGKVTKKSVIQWYTYFRDIMTTYFQNNHIIFENCTVHIDETAIRGKRKYNHGRLPPVKMAFWNCRQDCSQGLCSVHGKERFY